jgi:pimeloyl-ACP methyl ester carboxylesterase
MQHDRNMQKEFLYQSKKIFYRIEGAGMPIVLLHGFGFDSSVWNEQIDFLKDDCLLVIPDIPGSGQSEMLQVDNYQLPETSNRQSETFISIEDYAKCIHQLLIEENISQCIILGHSIGGYITLAFAKLFPEQLKAFGLVHSTAYADTEEKKTNRQRSIEMMDVYGGYAFLKNTIPNLFSKSFKEAFPEKVESFIEKAKDFKTEALQQYYAAMMHRPDYTSVVKDTEAAVLFVIGTEDIAAPMKDVLEQTQLCKNAYIHILEQTGHMGMLEAAKKMNLLLLDFIQKIENF